MKTEKLIFPSDMITFREVNDRLAKAEDQCKVDLHHGLVLHLYFRSAGVHAHRGVRGDWTEEGAVHPR